MDTPHSTCDRITPDAMNPHSQQGTQPKEAAGALWTTSGQSSGKGCSFLRRFGGANPAVRLRKWGRIGPVSKARMGSDWSRFRPLNNPKPQKDIFQSNEAKETSDEAFVPAGEISSRDLPEFQGALTRMPVGSELTAAARRQELHTMKFDPGPRSRACASSRGRLRGAVRGLGRPGPRGGPSMPQ